MRFPSHLGVAGLTLEVASLRVAEPLLHGVLHALGYGRTAGDEDWVLWAREGAQVIVRQADAPDQAVRGVSVQLRAASRIAVDAVCAAARDTGWRLLHEPANRPFAAGYYSGVLGGAEALGLTIEIVHAWDDLPETCEGGQRVRVPGVDGVQLSGYLFRPEGPAAAGVIILHGYGGDATSTGWTGAQFAKEGFAALSLSQRGWLGSTGDEDQGLRQPDDALAALAWLRSQPGCHGPVALLGYSQGGQVALLAAARPGADLLGVVAFFPPTDLAAWARDSKQAGIADYLADFVAPADLAACSPVFVADKIRCPALLVHGDADTVVPISQSRAMVAANPAIRLQEVAGATHAFTRAQYGDGRGQATAFLRDCLGARG